MNKLLLGCVMLLAGCAGQETLQQQSYLLPDVQQTTVATSSAPVLLVEVELAPYLDVNGIVYRISESQVVEAKQNGWAMDISEMVQHQAISLLRTTQSRYWPIELTPLLDTATQPKLLIKLDKFNGSFTGNAEIAGEWLLVSADGQILHAQEFNQAVALEADGYNALVVALNQALNLVMSEISQQL